MRVLLVRPYWLVDPKEIYYPCEPLALEYLAAVIKKDHKVCIYDCVTGDDCTGIDFNKLNVKDGTEPLHFGVDITIFKNKILSFKPDVIGVTAPFYTQDQSLKDVCRAIKEIDKNIKVVVGGCYPSAYKEHFLQQNPCVDTIVLGEGEVTFKELLDSNLKNLEKIKGIVFRKGKKIVNTLPRENVPDLNTIPFPAREFINFENYSFIQAAFLINRKFPKSRSLKRILISLARRRWFLHLLDNAASFLTHGKFRILRGWLITTRGCPLNCNFCVVHHVWGHRMRMRSAQNVLDEVKYLKKKYGVKHFEFVDDNFTISKDRTIEICKGLEKLNVTWRPSSGAFVQSLDREVLTWMKRSGCHFLTVAIENGNQEILKNVIGKNIDLGHVKEVLKICKELDIKTEGFFILGLPGETKETMIKTIEFAVTCGVDKARLYIAVPFPGTRLYDECMKYSYLTSDYDFSRLIVGVAGDIKTAVIKTDKFSPEDVIKLRNIGLKVVEENNFEKYRSALEAV